MVFDRRDLRPDLRGQAQRPRPEALVRAHLAEGGPRVRGDLADGLEVLQRDRAALQAPEADDLLSFSAVVVVVVVAVVVVVVAVTVAVAVTVVVVVVVVVVEVTVRMTCSSIEARMLAARKARSSSWS